MTDTVDDHFSPEKKQFKIPKKPADRETRKVLAADTLGEPMVCTYVFYKRWEPVGGNNVYWQNDKQ